MIEKSILWDCIKGEIRNFWGDDWDRGGDASKGAFENEFGPELEYENGVGFVAGPFHVPQHLWHFNHYGGVNQFGVRLIPHPRELSGSWMIINGDGFGGVYGHGEGKDMNGGRRLRNRLILPDVAIGPRAEQKIKSCHIQL